MAEQTKNVTDKAINDMSRQASDQAMSLYEQASTAKNAGDAAMKLGQDQASIYSKMAKNAKTAGWIEAGIDAAVAIAGGAMGFSGAENANAAADAFNMQHNLSAKDVGFQQQVSPWKAAFSSGINSTGSNGFANFLNLWNQQQTASQMLQSMNEAWDKNNKK